MINKEEVGQRLKYLREHKGNELGHNLSLSMVQNEIGKTKEDGKDKEEYIVDKNTLFTYERGNIPNQITKFLALSEYYGANIAWILTGEGKRFNKKIVSKSADISNTSLTINEDSESVKAFNRLKNRFIQTDRILSKVDFDNCEKIKTPYQTEADELNDATKDTFFESVSGVIHKVDEDTPAKVFDAYELYKEERRLSKQYDIEQFNSGISFLLGNKKSLRLIVEIALCLDYLERFDDMSIDLLAYDKDSEGGFSFRPKMTSVDKENMPNGFEYMDYLEVSEMHFNNAIGVLRSIYNDFKTASLDAKRREYEFSSVQRETVAGEDKTQNQIKED